VGSLSLSVAKKGKNKSTCTYAYTISLINAIDHQQMKKDKMINA